MTKGPIARQILGFALPLMGGNLFQMLYNTADSVIVGQFVGTQALAAIGATTMIVNLAVFFFNGFSIGAGVVISTAFGAGDEERLHTAVQTAITSTLALCVVFTIAGMGSVRPLLELMSTPQDVLPDAAVYLEIYFAGISGLLVYNMGSAVLRAVGDSRRPLIFLIFTSVLNIMLDLAFVIWLHLGIAGVAYATILAQAVCALLVLYVLSGPEAVYRFSWRDMRIDGAVFRKILAIGLPGGIQSVLTSFSNIFVQGYINYFGSSCMAGWGCYNKVDSFIFLPIQSMALAATTFVGQNAGAKEDRRVDRGTAVSTGLSVLISAALAGIIWVFAPDAMRLFTQSEEVIGYGILFIRTNSFFLAFNAVAQVLAAALRGRGDSLGPMLILLTGYVAVRQAYLYFVTRHVANTARIVGFGYPVGWMASCLIEVVYFALRWKREKRK